MSLASEVAEWAAERLGQLLQAPTAAEPEGAVPRRELFLRDGLSVEEVVHAHREALRVLRADLDEAWVDAISDGPWPPEVLPFCERALRLGDGRETGIDVDVRDDAQFEVMVALAPYSINVEGWGQGSPMRELYGAGDTGAALCVALTPSQEADLAARLAALGVTAAFYARK